jgi:hypothetical protein
VSMASDAIEVVDCLGRKRLADPYPDGSYNCPFCWAAVRPADGGCPNPACVARPGFPAETAREWLAKEEAKREEDARRAWQEQHAKDRATEREQKRQEAIVEANQRGACLRCLFDRYGRVKFVKHRKPCPNGAR